MQARVFEPLHLVDNGFDVLIEMSFRETTMFFEAKGITFSKLIMFRLKSSMVFVKILNKLCKPPKA